MYNVSNDFKEAILNNARHIKAHIEFKGDSYDIQTCTLDNNIYSTDIDAFLGTFIAKSGTIKVNKQDSLVLENESFNLFFGVQLPNGTIENVPVGRMNVYEKVSDTEYKFIDDKMLFNKAFDTTALTYPTTPIKALQEACRQAEVILETTSILNGDLVITNEVFFGYDATCSDVVIAVAQASCTFATINRSNKLELRWFKAVDFNIPLDNQYKYPTTEIEYGPINSLVLAREPQNDNVYIQDKESIELNGLTELKFSDNPFLDIDRYTSRNDIWNRINGFKYVPFVASLPGQFHLDVGDIVKLQLEDGMYIDSYILNHTMSYAGGIKSDFSSPALTKNQINYSVASTIESKILRTELIVDKLKGEINAEIKEINTKIEDIDLSLYRANLLASGTFLNSINNSITLNCQVLNGTTDITEKQADIQFQWYKNNVPYKQGKSIIITKSDVEVSSNFKCIVTVLDATLDTGNITIIDETDVANLGNSYLDVTGVQLVQTLNTDVTFSPDWTSQNAKITPSILDGFLSVELSSCAISYKKIVNNSEVALGSGETVSNGILTINKNIMTKTNPTVTYVCYVIYKSTSIKLFATFTLNIVGQSGEKGEKGSDGTSLVSVTPEFYLSTSKTAQIGSSWTTVQPTWSSGKFLWKRYKQVYKNPTKTEYTTPEVDTSWEAVNEIQIGGRNILLNSKLQTNIESWYGGVTDYVTKYNRKCAHRKSDALKNTYSLSQPVQGKLEPNTQYTMSGWVLTENIVRGTTNFIIMFYHDGNYNNNGTATWYGYGSKSFTINSGAGVWQYLTWTFSTDKTKFENSTGSNVHVYSRDFTGDIYFCNLKLEKGNKATDWSPAPEDLDQIHTGTTAPSDTSMLWYDTSCDILKNYNATTKIWEIVNDMSDDLNSMKQSITTAYQADLQLLTDSIQSMVSELQTTTGTNTTEIKNLVSQLQQNASSITAVTTSISEITNNLTGLATKAEISQWAKFENGILTLGESTSDFKVKLSTTELGFYQGDTKIAYLSNNQLNITQAVVMEKIRLGTFSIEYNDDTGLSIN